MSKGIIETPISPGSLIIPDMLVLGCGLMPNGMATTGTIARAQRSVELSEQYDFNTIVYSGGCSRWDEFNEPATVSESEASQAHGYAVIHNLRSTSGLIYVENHSTSTIQCLEKTQELLAGTSELVVVAHQAYMTRIRLIAGIAHQGANIIGGRSQEPLTIPGLAAEAGRYAVTKYLAKGAKTIQVLASREAEFKAAKTAGKLGRLSARLS